ncbi:40S ribosomal protein-like protein S12 [Protomyces lactucae-debilis]|uniref:40S ribosomal protein S12 n=1 Tax=Protomyces lactucae-debilis TaxID=2754530 RepID=A0A1Y2FNU7_PROLT|nr:40S ribosomal protein-like protein S12 [Protomyces lactucae-debilis]ORY85633.1 40S ribosomal protein-like protein S12 [Protomyces lactucae-debilis]
MSDNGEEVPQEEVAQAVDEVEVSADAPKGKMSVEDALKDVLKRALVNDGLARGLKECAKALDRRQAHLCVLCESCDEEAYTKLIEALCAEHKINLIKVGDNKKLGEMAGLCVLDREGNPRKVVGCSCVVVKDFGEDSEALQVLLEYFQSQ